MPFQHLLSGTIGENVADLHQILAANGVTIFQADLSRLFLGPATRDLVLVREHEHALGVTGIVEVLFGVP